jgi:hypothetical protein
MQSGMRARSEVLNPLGDLLSSLELEVETLRRRLEEMERKVQRLQTPTTLLSVKELAARHPAFTIGSLKWLLFHREENGLASVVVQLGRKILIDERKFLDWFAKKPGRGTSPPSGPRHPRGVGR